MSLLRIAIVIALATTIAFVFACGGDTESIDFGLRGCIRCTGRTGCTNGPR